MEVFGCFFLRGDHELNEVKISKILGEYRPATDVEIEARMNCRSGYIGPPYDQTPPAFIVDSSAAQMTDFVCGANEIGYHFRGCNWGHNYFSIYSSQRGNDLESSLTLSWLFGFDIRNAVEGDPSPDGKGQLQIARGIEVGHIFQLGTKYSAAMKAGIINEEGKNQTMIMGCYGIGVSRVVAASIEQSHDDRGIIWPASLAPFQVALCPMNMHKSERLKAAAEQLYQELINAGIEVLFDDRKVRAGFMFSDMELIGIPHSVVLSDRGLDAGVVEYKARTAEQNEEIALDSIIGFLKAKLS